MSVNCTRCNGTGWINLEQTDGALDDVLDDIDAVQSWIDANPDSDVQVCDCCGDGENWYGEPGRHYSGFDPPGETGPYAWNGGLCQCH